jgi:hypothetical protein
VNKAHHISFKGTIDKFGGAVALINAAGDCAIVSRGVPRTLVMICPDGCGETIAVNLDRRIGNAWRKFEHNKKLTIYPSVWKETGCRAHFIVWNDQILWCDVDDAVHIPIDESFIETVFNNLSGSNFLHFENLAESLQAIPWDVLWASNELVRRGIAQVVNRNTFKKVGSYYTQSPVNKRIDVRA